VAEDSILAFSLANGNRISVTDMEGISTTRLTVTNGTLNISQISGASIIAGANSSTTLTLSGTEAQINDALATLSFTGNLNFAGNATLTVLSTDKHGATATSTVTITVTQVNDPPVNNVTGSRTVNIDTNLAFTGTNNVISVTDVEGNLATTQLSVDSGTLTVTLGGGATISAGASGTNTLTLSGTQTQINSALGTLVYRGNNGFSGTDTLTIVSTDSNSVSDTDTIVIAVNNAANTAPVNTVPGAQTRG
jgi:hypothetical protein